MNRDRSQETRRRAGERGHAVIEVSLLGPWILFLFMGVFDFGFYSYAIIATQNAARIAALHTSSSLESAADQSGACYYGMGEMRTLPNIGSSLNSCSSLPVVITAQSVTGADGAPATRVTVTYQTVPLFPIPGLTGRLTLTRVVEMRAKQD